MAGGGATPSPWRALLAARPAAAHLAWFGSGMAIAVVAFLAYLMVFPSVLAAHGSTPARTAAPAPITVDVVGSVVNPGVYHLAASSRVEDAIALAGGVTDDGDASSLNLAAHLVDGQRVAVPLQGAAPEVDSTSAAARATTQRSSRTRATPSPAPTTPLDLNSASATQLAQLPGLTATTAQRIVDARSQDPFTSVDQLLERRLVSPTVFARIRDLLTVS